LKKLVIYTAEGCEGCEEARAVAREVATRHRLEVAEVDITKTEESPVAIAPSVCLVDTEIGEVPATLNCVLGFSDATTFRKAVEKMVETRVVV